MRNVVIRWFLPSLAIFGLVLAWCPALVLADPPTLQGLDPDKPMILPITVQAAYNDDTMFFNIQWDADRGDTHDLLRYTDGAWRKEGGPRREAQSTLDDDPSRGPTNLNSTNYESRVTWMINDPDGPNAVPNFSNVGCFCTCHDNSRAMPEWDASTGDAMKKYLHVDPDNPDAKLDLWHHRLARANPIGMSDDQKIIQTDGSGGRKGDGGEGSPYQTNNLITDEHGTHPEWLLNNDDTGGLFTFEFDDTHTDPNHAMMRDGDVPLTTIPRALDYHEALARGYVPQEDHTVSRRRLRDLRDNVRGDITAIGTTFTPDEPTDHFGHIESSTQRLLNTLDPDDTALADGEVYDIAFAIHTGMVTVRDHYVGFPMTLSLDADTPGDVQATKLPGSGGQEEGDTQPDWGLIPETTIELFLPGIASLEFLKNENVGKEYLDPETGEMVDQVHGGAGGMGSMSCTACHSESDGDMSMASLVPQRGGVWTPTPTLIPEPATIVLLGALAAVVGLARGARRRRGE